MGDKHHPVNQPSPTLRFWTIMLCASRGHHHTTQLGTSCVLCSGKLRVCRVIKRVSDSQGVWGLSQSLKLACVLGKALMSSDSEDEDISPTAGLARAQMRLLMVVMDYIIAGDYVKEPPAGFRPSALSRYATIFAKQSGSSRKKRLAALYPLLAAMVPKLDGAADMRMDDEGALEAFVHDNPRTDHIVIQCAMTPGDKDSDESISSAISYACALIAHWEVQQLLPANAERPCAALLCTQLRLRDCVIQAVVEEQPSSSDSDCSDADAGTYRIRPLVHIENIDSCGYNRLGNNKRGASSVDTPLEHSATKIIESAAERRPGHRQV